MRILSSAEEAIRGDIEALFGAVHPQASDCALVEFAGPDSEFVQVQPHVAFACGLRKNEERPEYGAPPSIPEQGSLTLDAILVEWPDAADRLLIWRVWPKITQEGFETLYCRLTAIPLWATDIRVTMQERDAHSR